MRGLYSHIEYFLPWYMSSCNTSDQAIGSEHLDLYWDLYRPQRNWGKVMFLHLSVILFTGGGLPHCMLGYTPPPQNQRQAPPRPEAGTAPPRPQEGTPEEQTPPPRDQAPPSAVHAGRYRQQAGGTHPTGMQSCQK